MATPRLDAAIERALEESGVPWTIEVGSKHYKIRVGGRLAGVLPKAGGKGGVFTARAAQNTASQIRRVARAMMDESR
jgi:hypothetical protein